MSDLLPQLRRLLSDETGSGWPLSRKPSAELPKPDGNLYMLFGQEHEQHLDRGGFNVWIFTAFVTGLAIFVGAGVTAFWISVRPPPRDVTFSLLPVTPMPAPPNKPSPNTIDELMRFVNTVTLPSAVMGTRSVPNITLHPEPVAHRIAPRGVYRPVPRYAPTPEPQNGYIGCPPSVCSPVERSIR